MAGPLIKLGDKTSRGGTIIESSPHSDVANERGNLPDKTMTWYDNAKEHARNHCYYGLSSS